PAPSVGAVDLSVDLATLRDRLEEVAVKHELVQLAVLAREDRERALGAGGAGWGEDDGVVCLPLLTVPVPGPDEGEAGGALARGRSAGRGGQECQQQEHSFSPSRRGVEQRRRGGYGMVDGGVKEADLLASGDRG